MILILVLLVAALIPGAVVAYRRGFDELGSVLAGLATVTIILTAAVITVIIERAEQPSQPLNSAPVSRP